MTAWTHPGFCDLLFYFVIFAEIPRYFLAPLVGNLHYVITVSQRIPNQYLLLGPISHGSALTKNKEAQNSLSNYYSLDGVNLLSEFLGLRCCRKVGPSATTKLPDHKDKRSSGLPAATYFKFPYSSRGF